RLAVSPSFRARRSAFAGASQHQAAHRAAIALKEDTMTPILGHPVTLQAPVAVRNALTIDVEDYYHVSAFESCVDRTQWDAFEPRVPIGTSNILDILEAAGVRATFFVLGWIAARQPRLIRAIHAAGHQIASHGYWHRLIYRQTPAEFRADLRRSRQLLEDIIGEPVIAYRAPSFSITSRNLWAFDVLIEEGFRFDSRVYPTYHSPSAISASPPP